MEARTVEQVEGWNSRPFSGGYAGLRELSDGEFSGAVRTGGAWLFMLNGRVIGVHEGELDDFGGADGTAYAAPHPSLPLLFSMQATGGDTRAKYYTNDTPLSEVDSTLTDGGFTGYVELSENVLSGDYYVAYYGGRSMSVAFVGASEQVVSGDEAFERAADEVGIYEVTDVDLEVIDLPEPEEPDEPTPDGASAAGADGDGGAVADPTQTGGSNDDTGRGGAAGGSPGTDRSEAEPSGARADHGPGAPSGADDRSARTAPSEAPDQSDRRRAERASPEPRQQADPTDADEDASGQRAGASSGGSGRAEATSEGEASAAEPTGPATAGEVRTESTPAAAADEATADAVADDAPDADAGSEEHTDERQTADGEAFEGEAEWRETTTIPSLDPDLTADDADPTARERAAAASSRSESASGSADGDRGTSAAASRSTASAGRQGRSRTDDASASGRTAEAAGPRESSPTESTDGDDERVAELRSELSQRDRKIEKLRSRLSSVESERDELKRERDALRQEVDRLESELDAVESGASPNASTRLGAGEAFNGTNLFVRYRSKGDATLKEAVAGNADADEVNANLQLEHHTQFEAADAAVDGAPFEEFLTDSFEYRFASWVVEQLLYEIRETGYEGRLRGLYDAIPKVDRVDFHGSVGAGADGDDTRQETFDVIMRDRMGNPLLVADLNDSRDPTTGEMMGSLVDAATGVAQAHEELVGAFQVTESFFEPAALETTETATSGGLLSREKRASFVKLSRKRGFHLCLVESRSGGFHLNVPEL